MNYKRPLIWVIDDSPVIRHIIAMALSREAGEVIEYAEPLQVLRDVIRGSHSLPDVVLVDLLLPNMSGYRLIQFLRSRKPEMAIIVITRLDGIFPQLMARLAGANAHLPKPFTTQQILDLLIEHSPH
jgi:twitching motility two-component system response regulator PilG